MGAVAPLDLGSGAGLELPVTRSPICGLTAASTFPKEISEARKTEVISCGRCCPGLRLFRLGVVLLPPALWGSEQAPLL